MAKATVLNSAKYVATRPDNPRRRRDCSGPNTSRRANQTKIAVEAVTGQLWNSESTMDSMELASELRRAGLRVYLYPEADKVGKQFKYASEQGIPFVTVAGEDERARGQVAIKNLRTGEQRSVKREAVADAIRAALNSTK